MAERLHQKLAKLYPPSLLASLCFGVSHGLPGTKPLSVHLSGGEIRILIWPRFISAKHTVENSEETLVLVFSGNEVTVKGLSLQPVAEAVKERRLEWLRALPSAYRNQRHGDETFVDHLSVLDVGNLPKSPEGLSSR
jgi:hypothetical protein